MSDKKPVVLVILDGWGYRQDDADNAVNNAQTPTMDRLWQQGPKTLIQTSGLAVGLPDGQMGNSEVGHTNIGAGRIVYQDFTRISKAIEDQEFQKNEILVTAIEEAVAAGKAVHLMGLLSPGGVHSHEDHIVATAKMAAALGATKIYLHCFLDGRDTPPKSAQASLEKLTTLFETLGLGRIVSLVGRYYAMDRDNNWDRVQGAYDLIAHSKADYQSATAIEGLQAAYDRDETDEFVKPTVIGDAAPLEDGDTVLFLNFRADRARELTRCFLTEFNQFERGVVPQISFVMLTEYAADIDLPVAFPPVSLENTFGEWLAKEKKTQLRISETEKYAHVTFFFNGGVETEFEGEDRILIPSPKVATYDLQPEMNSKKLTHDLVGAIESGKYDAIICNYPNGDMVGHTGVYEAAVKACEAVDQCLEKVVAAVEKSGAQLLITADHGNAEMMVDPETGGIHTAHTNLPVPLIYVGGKRLKFAKGGKLSDLAPTMLKLMGLDVPKEMSGKALI